MFFVLTQPIYVLFLGWTAMWELFVPGSGFFPCSDMPLFELKQLAAFVTAVVIVGLHNGVHQRWRNPKRNSLKAKAAVGDLDDDVTLLQLKALMSDENGTELLPLHQ
jgi:hypothetical protein